MTVQLPTTHNASFSPASFEDPAFEPQAGFDFDDVNDQTLRNMQNTLASLHALHGSAHNFHMGRRTNRNGMHAVVFPGRGDPFPVGSNAFTPAPGMSSNIDPSDVWSQSIDTPVTTILQADGTFSTSSMQSAIVQTRRSSVAQHFGQITPPDNSPGVKTNTPSDNGRAIAPVKMDKSQRARNAAIQRHAKAKPRKDSKQDEGLEGSGDDVDNKREKYREKNRLAAAKCRMKKKENVETLEEKHRRLQAENNFVKRQVRILRDELSNLRTMVLQHSPQSQGCHCQPLHGYNSRKANELAYGLGGQSMSSPSDSMGSAAPSPGTFDVMSQHHSFSSNAPPSQMHMPMPQSFAPSSNYAFAPVTTPNSVQMTATAGETGQQGAFSNFLRSSVDGSMQFP
ncbi:hypothetical protein LTR36_002059 [Oleoguttula mirabilis]|uniref:Basic leucine zipper transcriptional factor ATF-like n=1 Tax=Oleoguttula mirabilis TaxID=1507867 RepID=A0AAV9JM36_9PEZI|nr:hypothetical protein LTR36_002059 [Oleoguttula mirabilis]